MKTNHIYCGDSMEVLKTIPDESVNCCVTSPPYWGLRDYGTDGQLGLEENPDDYIDKLCGIFDEVKRVLRNNGTCWVNIGDTYGGTKKGNTDINKNPNVVNDTFIKKGGVDKSLCLIPFRFSLEMLNRGWILRNTIIWHKPNVMPQSIKDRFTVDFEYVFFFVKQQKYFFEQQFEPYSENSKPDEIYVGMAKKDYEKNMAQNPSDSKRRILESMKNGKGRNKRTVWSISTKAFKDAHFAVFPEALIEPMIKAGCPEGGIVLDPFMGAGTTALVAKKQGKDYVGIELNPEYIEIANRRLQGYEDKYPLLTTND